MIIKEGVQASLNGNVITITGPKGTLSYSLPIGILASIDNGLVTVSQKTKNDDTTKALFGLARAMIQNMVLGVSKGFEKKLELAGVGYRASVSGKDLTLSLGFSHPVKIPAPQGVTFTVSEGIISIAGIDRAIVGNTAAVIRKLKPPEPYKGKGVKYVGEKIRRKAGKAAKAVGGK